jgi:hypothetical protein
MRIFQDWTESPAGLGILAAAITAAFWRSVIKRAERIKANREINRKACDSFIRKNSLPDCSSIVWALDRIARQDSRKAYRKLKQSISPQELRRHDKEAFVVVSICPRKPSPGSKRRLIDPQPDDIDPSDITMCLHWHITQAESDASRSCAGHSPPSTSNNQAWQPPPTYTFAGCSGTSNQSLRQRCIDKIEAGLPGETNQQARDNMEACLAWIRAYGYPMPGYCMVWAACGVATCTTQAEFARFWAAHRKLPDRMSVYALGVTLVDPAVVVAWPYGLATALAAPPPRVGYEETWPEHFVMTEWLDRTPLQHLESEVRRAFPTAAPQPYRYLLPPLNHPLRAGHHR